MFPVVGVGWESKLAQQHVTDMIDNVLDAFLTVPMLPLKDFLCKREPSCGTGDPANSFEMDHALHCASEGIPYPCPLSDLAVPHKVRCALTVRELDLLKILIYKYKVDIGTGLCPDLTAPTFDVSQTVARAPVAYDCVPCILPGSKLVNLEHHDVLSGEPLQPTP